MTYNIGYYSILPGAISTDFVVLCGRAAIIVEKLNINPCIIIIITHGIVVILVNEQQLLRDHYELDYYVWAAVFSQLCFSNSQQLNVLNHGMKCSGGMHV